MTIALVASIIEWLFTNSSNFNTPQNFSKKKLNYVGSELEMFEYN